MDQNRTSSSNSGYSCQEIEQKLDDYLDNELSNNELVKFNLHIDQCSECKRVLSEFSYLKELAASLADNSLPPGVSERLRARLVEDTNWGRNSTQSRHLRLVK